MDDDYSTTTTPLWTFMSLFIHSVFDREVSTAVVEQRHWLHPDGTMGSEAAM